MSVKRSGLARQQFSAHLFVWPAPWGLLVPSPDALVHLPLVLLSGSGARRGSPALL